MDEYSPYQTPHSAAPPALPQGPPPQSVKVFGILHLVLAGLGVIFALIGFFSTQFQSMIHSMNPDDPSIVVQRKYQEDLWPISVMTSMFYLGLAALLLVAGLKLVREKADGVMWSHRYAWTSIVTKVISLVVTVAYVLPLTNRLMGEVLGDTRGLPAGSSQTIMNVTKSFTTISSILTPIIACIYPALALYFLSRPAVKAWVIRASGR
ncbi:hypothetical protein OKA04_06020 [Luteolibacter flavescens]|uniref:DUF2975 domain-containing protein n=1 Tax=Luteolibacter flavescens TaxID=1859460 RepID=A0ABT3FL39_9BACT|nr:hypothetical protein [Luteolibacter flavescens]MCW1884280.1 hypothetical protein [Luteolibacter flavescens]